MSRELTDDTEWDHPRHRRLTVGGSIQASRAFGEMAKKQPERAISLLNSFSVEKHERPVAYALEGLAESTLPPAELAGFIVALDKRGFHSNEFRVHAAWALDKAIGKGHLLSNEVCSLLEGWLKQMQAALPTERIVTSTEAIKPSNESILWGRTGLETLPQGTFTVLETLSRAYLSRKPMEANRWLELLERHLAGPETAATWNALWRFLPYLHNANHSRATDFMRSLFDRYPEVRDGAHGAFLLAHLREWTDPEFLRSSIEALQGSAWPASHQAYGELLPLFAVLPAHHWAAEKLDEVLAGNYKDRPNLNSVRVGLAHASANLWMQPLFRALATRILTTLAALPDPDVGHAISDVFRVSDSLPSDEYTTALLEAFLTHPDILMVGDSTFLVDRLNDVLPSRTELVVRLARSIVNQLAAKPTEVRSTEPLPTAELVNLAMTVQRLEGDIRIQGLEMFEQLLLLDIHEARGTLTDLDNRPTVGFIPLQRRRLRRSRHRPRQGRILK